MTNSLNVPTTVVDGRVYVDASTFRSSLNRVRGEIALRTILTVNDPALINHALGVCDAYETVAQTMDRVIVETLDSLLGE